MVDKNTDAVVVAERDKIDSLSERERERGRRVALAVVNVAKEQSLPLLVFLCSAGKVNLFDMQQFQDDVHETFPRTHSVDAPRETG